MQGKVQRSFNKTMKKCPNCNSTKFKKCYTGTHYGKSHCERCGYINDINYRGKNAKRETQMEGANE